MSRHIGRMLCVLAVLSGGAGGLSGCSGGSYASPAPPSAVTDAITRHVPVDTTLVDVNNAFGFDLFEQLVKADATQNVFMSPASVALALEIVADGAKGETLTGMQQTLHLTGKTPAEVNTANAALQASLISPDPNVQLYVANSLWLNPQKHPVQPAFLTANTTYYGSEIGDLNGAPDNINTWVRQHTQGKITSIADPEDYKNVVAILVNAVYFKGKWSMPFDPANTRTMPFTRLDSATTNVQMMNKSGLFGYYKGENCQVVRLPYGSKRLSLIVALPDKGTDWHTFLAGLSGADVKTWAANFKETDVAVGLPRFETDYKAELKDPLTKLGMALAFDSKRADLSGIADQTYIEYVRHKTFLKVDEEGTEAAAVTAVEVATKGIAAPAFQMLMDHPFFCVIRDDKTGELLFMGCIVDPSARSKS